MNGESFHVELNKMTDIFNFKEEQLLSPFLNSRKTFLRNADPEKKLQVGNRNDINKLTYSFLG